ncbi:MAG TPA: lyase family protein [Solirubrobacteraceae bacterium]|nr:lyase family protein [Solirubrobacteraceae bacterium]
MLDSIYGHTPIAELVSERAWVQAMLDVEAALASALASMDEVPAASAARIAAACDAGRYDLGALARETARHASPVVGLVAAVREQLPAHERTFVHIGATSQDIVDTALMLIAKRALTPLLATCGDAAERLFELAHAHRQTPMIARTLLQQALPITFGLRAATWLDGIDAARARLRDVREHGLAVQMGGPVGGRDPEVARRVADALGLVDPVIGWGATRVRTAQLASALGVLAGVLGKLARDVTLLAADEVGELSEGGDDGGGRSSAMAHKHNPVAAVSTLACTRRVPGLVATMLWAMEAEHERAAGAWQAEWGTLAELLTLTGSAASWTGELVAGLRVHPERMAANLRASATGDQPPPAGIDKLIDRVLTAHLSAVQPGGFSTVRPGQAHGARGRDPAPDARMRGQRG